MENSWLNPFSSFQHLTPPFIHIYFSISFTFFLSFQHVFASIPATVPWTYILGAKRFGDVVLGDRRGLFSYKDSQEAMADCQLLLGLIRTGSTAMVKAKMVVLKIHHVRCVHVTMKQIRSSEGRKPRNVSSLQLAEEKDCAWTLHLWNWGQQLRKVML